MPEQASTFAKNYDALFLTITALAVFFTIVVFSMVLFFVVKYRRGKKADRSNPVHDHLKVELTWTIIPTILGLLIFVWGAQVFVQQRTIPEDALEIHVIGKQWMWHVQHPDGTLENNEIHIPKGVPIKLTMISQDVVHGLYIPQFRVQYHVVPGRYTTTWFQATKTGRFNLFCSMHCGTQHSEMGGYVYVMEPEEYAAWLEKDGNRFVETPKSLVQAGEQLWNEKRCSTCHGAQDSDLGPSLVGILGRQRQMTDGRKVVADEAYIRNSILNPWDQIVAPYSQTMPSYAGDLSEEDILHLIAYLKSLGGSTQPAPADAQAPEAPIFELAPPATDAAQVQGDSPTAIAAR